MPPVRFRHWRRERILKMLGHSNTVKSFFAREAAKLADQDSEPSSREMPRGKRERVYKHYSYTLTLILDELGAPEGCREFVEALIVKIGFDETEWVRCCDETLARFVACAPGRVEAAKQRMYRQRRDVIAWQENSENPTFIQHRLVFEQEVTRQYSEYKLPVAGLLRDVIAACPVGTRERALKEAVRRIVLQFIRDNAALRQKPRNKKHKPPESKFKMALTLAAQGYAEEKQAHGDFSAQNVMERHIRKLREVQNSSLTVSEFFTGSENAKNEKLPIDNIELNGKSRHQNDYWSKSLKNESFPQAEALENEPESGLDSGRHPIGQTVEEFIAAQESEPKPQRSSKVEEWFSLAELEAFDPNAGGRNKRERRFCCPICNDGKRKNPSHRSVSVNTQTGAYNCHRCGTFGKIREMCDGLGDAPARKFPSVESVKEEKNERWRKWLASARPISGTRGAEYLTSRAVPVEQAERAGAKFGTWWRWNEDTGKAEPFDAVIFPMRNIAGEIVAATARAIKGSTKNTRGSKSEAVFPAPLSALDAGQVAIVEGPADALVLAACGLDALAIMGTSWPDCLVEHLTGRDVLLATDADVAGDRCADELHRELEGRAVVIRLRPDGAKDWADLADLEGLDGVRAQMGEILNRLKAVTV